MSSPVEVEIGVVDVDVVVGRLELLLGQIDESWSDLLPVRAVERTPEGMVSATSRQTRAEGGRGGDTILMVTRASLQSSRRYFAFRE
jgi:hypothetical protein